MILLKQNGFRGEVQMVVSLVNSKLKKKINFETLTSYLTYKASSNDSMIEI